jgi:hypothetical protein
LTPARYDDRVNYLAALFERPVAVLLLVSGEVMRLARLGLGRHFQLQAQGREIGQVPLKERAEALRKWLTLAGVQDPDRLALADLSALIREIRALNAPRGRLAWDEIKAGLEVEVKAVDYPGRALARIVDTLARHYGWDLERIINLPPEVALAHLQECILADRRKREWEYYLSEIAWEYDKRSKKSHYRPLPPLPWEALPASREYKPVPEWVREKYYPKGVVIDLSARGAAGPGE